jgi:hypothetical protein
MRDPRDELRPEAPAAPGPRRPRAPDHRPAWLVLLGLLTLAYGGRMLVSSLDTFRDPTSAAHLPPTRALTPAEDEIAREIEAASQRVAAAHASTMRGAALASVPVALLLLFAAAATLSRDRRGRTATLAAAWTGIAYQLAALGLTIPLARDLAREAAPPLARLAALQAGTPDPRLSADEIAKVVVAFPVVVAVVAIVGSLILIRYFGGRHGRVLYGLEPARTET